jgi:patatin-related protein
VASFLTESKHKGKPGAITRFLQKRYSLGARTSDDAWFVDGGVLDNAPFDLAIDAIANRAAQTQVKRHLIYIDPDPPAHLALASNDAPAPHDAPGYLGALLHGAVGVKGSHSVLPDLIRIRELNLRIAEIGAIADLQIVPVNDAVQAAWLQAGTPDQSRSSNDSWSMNDLDDITDLSTKLHDSVPGFIGAAYPTYCRLKVDVSGRRLADELAKRLVFPPDSAKSSFLRAVISAWARKRPEWENPDPAELMALLGPIDVPYRERRLKFLLAGINDLYASSSGNPPPRGSLDALKQEGWQLLKAIQAAIPNAIAAISPAAVEFLENLDDEAIFEAPEQFAKENDQQFVNIFKECTAALQGDEGQGRPPLLPSNAPMWSAFQRHTRGWDAKDSRDLLSRYMAFPLWDALIFPIVSLGEVPQFTPIPVTQYSPIAASAIPAPGGKLKGISLHHFGGFTDASWRANDFLWGRLDGVELILRTLRSTHGTSAPPLRPLPPEEAVAAAGTHLASGVAAVLASEANLNHLDPKLLTQLKIAVGALAQ